MLLVQDCVPRRGTRDQLTNVRQLVEGGDKVLQIYLSAIFCLSPPGLSGACKPLAYSDRCTAQSQVCSAELQEIVGSLYSWKVPS